MADKPFPWTCGNCAQKRVEPVVGDYETDIKHDGTLHHIVLPQIEIPTCQNCGTVHTSIDIGAKVTKTLREKVGLLFPEEIKQQRTALNLNQEQLGECIGAAKESISRWETGALIQSVSTDKLLRMFFKHPTDSVWKNRWIKETSAHLEEKLEAPSDLQTAIAASVRLIKGENYRIQSELYSSVERRLLSRLLIENSLIPWVEAKLSEDDFQHPLLKHTYKAVVSLYHSWGEVAPKRLVAALNSNSLEIDANPGVWITFLVNSVEPEANTEKLVDTVSRSSRFRRELSEYFSLMETDLHKSDG